MKVVLDTNVVVSAAFFGGPPRSVVNAWIDGQLHLVISPLIFDEYLRVCHRLSASYPKSDYQPLLTAFLAHGLLVADPTAERGITLDADDDKFMRCALEAEAAVLSGDRHLLDVDGWRGIRVLTPTQLLAQLAGRSQDNLAPRPGGARQVVVTTLPGRPTEAPPGWISGRLRRSSIRPRGSGVPLPRCIPAADVEPAVRSADYSSAPGRVPRPVWAALGQVGWRKRSGRE